MIELTIDQVRALIQGKFDFRPCLECGGTGAILADGRYGLTVQGIPEDRDASDFSYERCDACDGLGGKLLFT